MSGFFPGGNGRVASGIAPIPSDAPPPPNRQVGYYERQPHSRWSVEQLNELPAIRREAARAVEAIKDALRFTHPINRMAMELTYLFNDVGILAQTIEQKLGIG